MNNLEKYKELIADLIANDQEGYVCDVFSEDADCTRCILQNAKCANKAKVLEWFDKEEDTQNDE